jgi:hypothetical protein
MNSNSDIENYGLINFIGVIKLEDVKLSCSYDSCKKELEIKQKKNKQKKVKSDSSLHERTPSKKKVHRGNETVIQHPISKQKKKGKKDITEEELIFSLE